MTRPPATPKIPVVLPLIEAEERVLFPFAFATVTLPAEMARALLAALPKGSEMVALGPAPTGGRRPRATVGTAAQLLRVTAVGSGRVDVALQGTARVRLEAGRRGGGWRTVRVHPLPEAAEGGDGPTLSALRRTLEERLDQMAGTSKGLSSKERELLRAVQHPGRYSDLLASSLQLSQADGRPLLDQPSSLERMRALLAHLDREVEILTIQESIERQTRDELDRRHKEFYLRQQMEAIQSELGEGETEGGSGSYLHRLEGVPVPPEVAAVLQKEIARLSRFSPFSEEQNQVRAYLDLVLDLPWGRASEDRLDLAQAKKELDRDHYGLKKIKERILEHLAVAKLRGGRGGTLFCLVGPPGVGKTSLGRAVARTLGRTFVRMSLGGVRDESEIRGHRKTYIGAMPGRIIQGIRNAGTINPVFLLDEVDKMGSDWRGDPSSALLEALDGEQNREFVDHYLGFPFDLSRVMFIATANTLDGIHPALLDRLELLELPGYSEEEKVAIALRYILPRELEAHGLAPEAADFPEVALRALIRRYTREAGVRGLERGIRSVLRRIARRVAEGEPGPCRITPGTLHHLVGHAPILGEERPRADRVGVAAGMAWTEMGGEMLYVEATATQGQGVLTLTGQMGEVMRESAQAALTYIKEHMREWRLTPKDFAKRDIHIHVPEGSIPKDGPSAGVTMAVAMLSTMTGRPVHHAAAFSGEITLRGEILPVGGLREKLLAAERASVRKVLLPAANRPERRDLPRSVLKNLELVWVRTMDEVFPHALGPAQGRGVGTKDPGQGTRDKG